jgi:hypothetical protein
MVASRSHPVLWSAHQSDRKSVFRTDLDHGTGSDVVQSESGRVQGCDEKEVGSGVTCAFLYRWGVRYGGWNLVSRTRAPRWSSSEYSS